MIFQNYSSALHGHPGTTSSVHVMKAYKFDGIFRVMYNFNVYNKEEILPCQG